MKNKLFIGFTSIMLILNSCKEDKICEIRIVDSQTIDNITMYAVYTSDTCWNEMVSFTDSLTESNKKKSKYSMVAYLYPEENIPHFKPNSFALTGGNFDKAFIIMKIQDSVGGKNPYRIEKYPENYFKARKKN